MSRSHAVEWRSIPMPGRQGIVLDASERSCTVLTPDGQFLVIRPIGQASVGQEICFAQSQVLNPRGGLLSSLGGGLTRGRGRVLAQVVGYAAVLLLSVTPFVGHQARRHSDIEVPRGVRVESRETARSLSLPTPLATAAYVTIDINPSIEFAVDRDEVVISCRGMNDDGVRVLSQVEVVGQRLEEAVVRISQMAYEMGYLKQGQGNQILLTGASVSDLAEGQLEKDLQVVKTAAIKGISESDPRVKLQVEAVAVSQDVRAKAEQVNLSMGKFIVLGTARTAGSRLSADQMRRESLRNVLKSVGLGVKDIAREYGMVASGPVASGDEVSTRGPKPGDPRRSLTSPPTKTAGRSGEGATAQADRSKRADAAKETVVTVLPTLRYSDIGKMPLPGDLGGSDYSEGWAPDPADRDDRRKVIIEFDLLSQPAEADPKARSDGDSHRASQGPRAAQEPAAK